MSTLRRLLRNYVARVFALIAGEDGTNTLLEDFKTNIKSVVFDVLQQQTADLKRRGITVAREFPEEACTVFGEDIFVAQILQNLIENVWKSSKASLLKIHANRNNENQLLELRLLDNGQGLPDSFAFGQGLKVVRANARACCGDFELHNLSASDIHYEEGFRTVAAVTLPLL
jgi:glucose-6-phosphate-specific signal transduction histidine kinase